MRAFEIEAFGLERLRRVERAPPRPSATQMLVRVGAASLNFRDLLMIGGDYNPKQPLPLIPGSDGVGEVVEIGAQVSRFKKGDRVITSFFQAWESGEATRQKLLSTLGGPIDGTFAEMMLVEEQGAVLAPAYLSDEEAATLPCAALTAWNALVHQGAIRAGETVLVQGTGGVSLFALQFARMHGARVIVTSSSDEKLQRAKELGAWACINYKSTPDWSKIAREITGGNGVDHIVEVGGAATLEQSIRCVRHGGVISLIGILSGVATPLLLTPLLMQSIRIQGVYVGPRELFEEMNKALEVNNLHPVVDKVFAFDELPIALARMKQAAHFGKIVVRMR